MSGRRRRHRRVPIVAACVLLLVAGCSQGGGTKPSTPEGAAGDPSTTTSATPEPQDRVAGVRAAPEGDAFYVAPPGRAPAEPGEVIWADPLDTGPTGTRGWRILYGSRTVGDQPTAVSGLLFVPDPLPDARPLPVLAVAHGTTGLADRCAPSRVVAAGGASEVTALPADILASHVVVATDYEGLGTPGVHPYLVSISEARSVLDGIRAAQRFPGSGTAEGAPSLVWGHSQGGGAALVAAELAPTYAPDTNVRGVAAGAPAAELRRLATALRGSPSFGYLLMAAAGFAAAYPDLDLGRVLTEAGEAAAARAAEQCGSESLATALGRDPTDFVAADPGTVEPFATRLEENSPGARATTVPVLLYHGEADEVVPAVVSSLVLDRYCRNGTVAARHTYPGHGHGSVVGAALPDIRAFLSDRLAGKPPPSSC